MVDSSGLVSNIGVAASTSVSGITAIYTGGSSDNSVVAVVDSSGLVSNIGVAASTGVGGITAIHAGGSSDNCLMAMSMFGLNSRDLQIEISGRGPLVFLEQTQLCQIGTHAGQGHLEASVLEVIVIAVEVEAVSKLDVHMVGGCIGLGDVQVCSGTADNQAHAGVIVIGAGGHTGDVSSAAVLERVRIVALVETDGAGEADALFTGCQELSQGGNDRLGECSGIQQSGGNSAVFVSVVILLIACDCMQHQGVDRSVGIAILLQRSGESIVLALGNCGVIHTFCSEGTQGEYGQKHRQTQNDGNDSFHLITSYIWCEKIFQGDYIVVYVKMQVEYTQE